MPQAARLLYCHCAYARVVPDAVKQQVLRGLTESGAAFEAVADLCELSAKRDPAMQELAGEGPLRIAACYPRAVKWLFHAAGAPLSDELVQVSNMREQTAEDVVNRLLSDNAIEESGP